jgi:diacylglycerol kinase family enzyme
LIAVGGDGTIAELANRTEPGVPLAIFPSGTSNLLARQLGFAARPEAMVETILRGNLVAIDAGSASGRLFLLMIGCGFDAEVVARVHALRDARRGGHLSYWSYIKPILQSIRSYRYPEIRICAEEDGSGLAAHAAPIVARWAFVLNLPRYGWGLRIDPDSDCRDGLLELYAFRCGSLWHGLRYAACTQIGLHTRLKDCIRRPVRRLRITAEQPVAYQLDGDPGGVLPVDIEVMPGRVSMLMPPCGPSGW